MKPSPPWPGVSDFLARNRPGLAFVAELLWLDMLEANRIPPASAFWYTLPTTVGHGVEFHFEGIAASGRTWKSLTVMSCEQIDLGHPLGLFAHHAAGFLKSYLAKKGE